MCLNPENNDGTHERLSKLSKVFVEFDLDDDKSIQASELLQLGKMRRTLSQKCGDWDEAKNERLVKKMDVNGDGLISDSEFATHFQRALPKDMKQFDTVVDQFMQVAKACRAAKQGSRKLGKDRSPSPSASVNRRSPSPSVSRTREPPPPSAPASRRSGAAAADVPKKYSEEKRAAEAAAANKRQKTAAHQAKQLERAGAKVKKADADVRKIEQERRRLKQLDAQATKERRVDPSNLKYKAAPPPACSESENKRRTFQLWAAFDSFVSNRNESIRTGVIRQLGKAHETLGAKAGWDSTKNSSLMCKLRVGEQDLVGVDGSTFVTQLNHSLDRLAGHEFDLLIEEFKDIADGF